MYACEIQNLTKHYKGTNRSANKEITLRIKQGEFLGLLGPNGSGKTTLARQILGLLEPDSGEIKVFSEDVVHHPDRAASYISYMPQGGVPQGLGHLDVSSLLYYMGRLGGFEDRKALRSASDWIERLKLGPISRRLIGGLSGGERRFVGFAASLILEKPILLLDEPTNDLDPEARRLLWSTLSDLKEERQLTLILITHNLLEADKVLDSVGFMSQGRLIMKETVSNLKAVSGEIIVELAHRGSAPNFPESLGQMGQWTQINSAWRLISSQTQLPEISTVLSGLSKDWHYRIHTSSLEDVYFKVVSMTGTNS